jgi:dTDP-4-amino-4,6-dideoxygalactose transaminase
MPTQVFVPNFRIEETLAEIRQCLERGWTGMGFKTVELEDAWKAYTSLPHAHFLGSATAGLHLALALPKTVYNWEEGDEVITTPMTFVSTNHAILYERLRPVFADVDQFLCLDPAEVESKITPRTRAVMFVGLGGNTGQLEKVAEICKRRGLFLVLDAAHMSGTRLHGRDPGHIADCTVYSYQAVKNMPTADSGMICFRDAHLDKEARKMSWLGISKDTFARAQKGTYSWMYDVEYAGFKYNGNAVMAAMGLVSLRYLDRDNAYRRQLAAWYDGVFTGVDNVLPTPVAPGCESARHFYQIQVENRDGMLTALNEAEIFPGVHYRDNTHYRMYADSEGQCPKARLASDRVLSLPMHLGVTRAEVENIANIVIQNASEKLRKTA